MQRRQKMKFGAGFPLAAQEDPVALRDMAQALDGAGFDYVTTAGHLLCAPPDSYPERPPQTYVGPFREPFVFFAYLAAVTRRLAFRTGILIVPLFPTALVAKQAAELSRLSGGRFQLGVGISWNQAEYEALGQDFTTRGRRMEEQIVVLRRLWTEPFVTFEGRFHTLHGVGLHQLPPQPIPVWIGCAPQEPLLRRVARVADGWLPQVDPAEPLVRLRGYLREAGRDPADFGVTWRLLAGPDGPESWVETVRQLESIGVTDVTINAPPDVSSTQSLQRIIEARQALAAAGY
jgi:probable F420-dependent oxidoreductase